MISDRAKGLQPSPTLALATKAKELKAQGHDVISLSVGEPDWDTFDSVKRAGILAIENGETKYAPSNGIPELRKAIAGQVNNDLSVNYKDTEVTVSTGGKFILFSIMQVICNPGDEVIIPAPYWVSYPVMTELAGGKPIVVECGKSENYKLTPELLEKSITKKTKALILNSPSNPTGFYYSLAELKALAKVLESHPGIVIISDDIYNRLVFSDSGLAPHILMASKKLKDRTVIVNGVSKTYSMTGWRLGWALGPAEIIGAMNKYQSQTVSCASPFTQKAAVQAIVAGGQEFAESLIKLKKRRDFVFSQLTDIDGFELQEPQGAFYAWPNVSAHFGKSYDGQKIENSKDFAKHLLEDQMVVAVPGVDFGLEGYLRMSYALSTDRMGEAVTRIKSFLAKLES
ncbi:MAG: pyridoxal phosphate-dependent aminotransferase [Bdellovibrionaceae bacterium]|jgi:aspartate aminotransferase|nr:pyridoxal phosphate-dependent aminotransferase [Pseudobdellovibrionaceae bacterium]